MARQVYEQYADAAGMDVRGVSQGEYCAPTSFLLHRRLVAAGMDARMVRYTGPHLIHYYVDTPTEGGYVFDMTWQQFLSKARRNDGVDRPPLLVAKKDGIHRQLEELGMSRRRFPIWQEGIPYALGEWTLYFCDPPFREIMKRQWNLAGNAGVSDHIKGVA